MYFLHKVHVDVVLVEGQYQPAEQDQSHEDIEPPVLEPVAPGHVDEDEEVADDEDQDNEAAADQEQPIAELHVVGLGLMILFEVLLAVVVVVPVRTTQRTVAID